MAIMAGAFILGLILLAGAALFSVLTAFTETDKGMYK